MYPEMVICSVRRTDVSVTDLLATDVLVKVMHPWTSWPRERARADVLAISFKQNKHKTIQFDCNIHIKLIASFTDVVHESV